MKYVMIKNAEKVIVSAVWLFFDITKKYKTKKDNESSIFNIVVKLYITLKLDGVRPKEYIKMD
tara:strand:+ start:318 stop:506 length:189 start_codon:yes stop_codon:yes gene_type:complete